MELITAVVILGLLTVVAIISVNRLITNSQERYYEQQRQLVLVAGMDFFTTNTARLPERIGDERQVSLETLISEGYISPILGHLEDACYTGPSNSSYYGFYTLVTVRRNANNDFDYRVYLNCPHFSDGSRTEHDINPEDVDITIRATTDGTIGIERNNTQLNRDLPRERWTNGNIIIYVDMTEEADSYQYRIVEIDSNGNETGKILTASESRLWTGNAIQIPIRRDGIWRVEVTATVIGGGTRSETAIFFRDATPPTCGVITTPDPSWSNAASRNQGVNCSDSLSGCTQDVFNQIFTRETLNDNITIMDSAGNIRSCMVPVRLDRTPPVCGVATTPNPSWSNASSRSQGISCSDSLSGCTQSVFTQTFTAESLNGNITIRDNAGNTRVCSVPVRLDSTIPQCGGTGWPGWSAAASRYISVSCSSPGPSGCQRGSFSHNFVVGWNSSQTTGTIQIRNNAGTTANCQVNVMIDRISPSCYVNTHVSSGGWDAWASCSGGYSGCQTSPPIHWAGQHTTGMDVCFSVWSGAGLPGRDCCDRMNIGAN